MQKFKRNLEIRHFSRDGTSSPPAYVQFAPDILWIDESSWALAQAGGGYAQFVIAHEIGHLVLHASLPKGFSKDPSHQIRYAEEGHSAEWQANTFAAYLLLPTPVVEQFQSAEEIAEICEVWEEIAKSRFDAVHKKNIVYHGLFANGQACANCGNFSIKINGTERSCDFCNSTYSS